MIYEVFAAIKEQLEIYVPQLKKVCWFNDQYEGLVGTVPVVFLEFPKPVPISSKSKDGDRGRIVVRVHVVSKLHSQSDSSPYDSRIESHETLTDTVYQTLKHFEPVYQGLVVTKRKLIPEQLTVWQKERGFTVSLIDFYTEIK